MQYSASVKKFQPVTVGVTTSGATPWNALWVTTTGNATLVLADGTSETLTGITPGFWHGQEFVAVSAATATGIFGGRV